MPMPAARAISSSPANRSQASALSRGVASSSCRSSGRTTGIGPVEWCSSSRTERLGAAGPDARCGDGCGERCALAPEGTGSACHDAECTGPDGTAPEGTGPEGTEPVGTGPDGTGPDGTGPDGIAPA